MRSQTHDEMNNTEMINIIVHNNAYKGLKSPIVSTMNKQSYENMKNHPYLRSNKDSQSSIKHITDMSKKKF
jgi:hypothetical protein